MCGICGIFDYKQADRINPVTLDRMIEALRHRGPDDTGRFIDRNIALGFCRLSIIDLDGGHQPIENEDNTLTLICNGEIFNYKELTANLKSKGHRFKTSCDVEVILHLYEEYGDYLVNSLNGQFSFVLYDGKRKRILCARDHAGIEPFYYAVTDSLFIFGSEIKAILEHEYAEKQLDLTGLDQIMNFPGLVSPRTLFKNIRSLKAGHFLTVDYERKIREEEYWDLIYPGEGEIDYREDEAYYIERLDELLTRSVKLRLIADVPIGFYISGGLDSAVIGGKIKKLGEDLDRHSFSVNFLDKTVSEGKYQRIVANGLKSIHHEIDFDYYNIASGLRKAIYHAECALKESYNTASLALSEAARANGIKAVLTGEGADELFGGYIGYRFDKLKSSNNTGGAIAEKNEELMRIKLWGDPDFLYEKNYYAYKEVLKSLYSEEVNAVYKEICCLDRPLVNQERLKGISVFHKRSYIDFKLRMSDHLLTDHGDRMALANSVEARYPFLDRDIIEFSRTVPDNIKLRNYNEKYILKRVAERLVPKEIINRPKFAFVAPGSQTLLRHANEYINDILSYETIKRQNVFNPDTVEELKRKYLRDEFKLNIPYDDDLLIIVITFGIFLDNFKML